MTKLFDMVKSKQYWLHIVVIVISIMLFQNYVSQFILKYIQVNELILSFVSMTIILVVADLLLHLILELD